MEYKNFLIVASKLDAAGINMTTQLSQFQEALNANFRFYLVDEEIIYTENLDLEKKLTLRVLIHTEKKFVFPIFYRHL